MEQQNACVALLSRHDERIKTLEKDFSEIKNILRQIYFALAAIAGGVIVSLVLLVLNMGTGR